MPTVKATPGASDANSYLTRIEGDTYYENRLFSTIWTGATADTKDAALIMATRTLEMMLSPYKYFVPATTGLNAREAHWITRPTWTGEIASDTQALAWPRIGMFDRNGNEIDELTIPQDLKNATAELAGQLIRADRTLDNDVSVQGIVGIKAGPVELKFKDGAPVTKVLPDNVLFMLVPSWLTDTVIEYFTGAFDVAEFDVVSE